MPSDAVVDQEYVAWAQVSNHYARLERCAISDDRCTHSQPSVALKIVPTAVMPRPNVIPRVGARNTPRPPAVRSTFVAANSASVAPRLSSVATKSSQILVVAELQHSSGRLGIMKDGLSRAAAMAGLLNQSLGVPIHISTLLLLLLIPTHSSFFLPRLKILSSILVLPISNP